MHQILGTQTKRIHLTTPSFPKTPDTASGAPNTEHKMLAVLLTGDTDEEDPLTTNFPNTSQSVMTLALRQKARAAKR